MLHFFVLGSLCFAAVQWGSAVGPEPSAVGEPPTTERLTISATRALQLSDQWTSTYGSAPSPDEMDVLIANEIDEEILFREALRLGLNRTDPVVRKRLAQNMGFLATGESRDSGNETDRVRRALGLGMDRTDLVVRRRLIQRMQAALESRAVEPTDEEIRAYVASNSHAFSSPPRYRIAYAFESHADSTAPAEARRDMGTTFRARDTVEKHLPHTGLLTPKQIEQTFGDAIARRISTLEPGSRIGPVPVAHGHYWIRVDQRVSPRPHDFEVIRNEVAQLLRLERRRRARSEAMGLLRRRYEMSVPIVARIEPGRR